MFVGSLWSAIRDNKCPVKEAKCAGCGLRRMRVFAGIRSCVSGGGGVDSIGGSRAGGKKV